MASIGARLGALIGGAILLMFMMQLFSNLNAYVYPEAFDLAAGTGTGDTMGRLILILIPIGYSLLTLSVAFAGTVASIFIRGGSIYTTIVSGVIFVIVGLAMLGTIGTYQDNARLSLGGDNAGAYTTASACNALTTDTAQTNPTAAAANRICIGSVEVANPAAAETAAEIGYATSIYNDLAVARLVVDFYQVFFILNLAAGVFVGFSLGGSGTQAMGSLRRMGNR